MMDEDVDLAMDDGESLLIGSGVAHAVDELPDSDFGVRVAEVVEQEDSINVYAPTLGQVKDRPAAELLLSRIGDAADLIEALHARYCAKSQAISELDVNDVPDVNDVSLDFHDHISTLTAQIARLEQVACDPSPYEALAILVNQPDFQALFEGTHWEEIRMRSQTAFQPRNFLTALFRKEPDSYPGIRKRADLDAKWLIGTIIHNRISEIERYLGSAYYAVRTVSSHLYNAECVFTRLDESGGVEVDTGELEAHLHQAQTYISLLSRPDPPLPEGVHFLTPYQEIKSHISQLENEVDGIQDRLARVLRYNLCQGVNRVVRDIPGYAENSATREAHAAADQLNRQISALDLGSEAATLYFNSLATESKKISKGRLMTHSFPRRWGYEVLKSGALRSQDAQRRASGGFAPNIAHPKGFNDEVYEICFEVNAIYRNFREAPIALVFSENDLLREGRTYSESDGIHVFDADYDPDAADRKGLEIDLRNTPFIMMVAESEKQDFLNFLKTESIWKDEIAQMDEIAFDEWLKKRVTFAPSVCFTAWSDFDDFVQDAHERMGVQPRKGYVERTDKMQSGLGPSCLKRFVVESDYT